MAKFKTGMIYILSIALAFETGVLTSNLVYKAALKDLVNDREERRRVSYRDYRR